MRVSKYGCEWVNYPFKDVRERIVQYVCLAGLVEGGGLSKRALLF